MPIFNLVISTTPSVLIRSSEPYIFDHEVIQRILFKGLSMLNFDRAMDMLRSMSSRLMNVVDIE